SARTCGKPEAVSDEQPGCQGSSRAAALGSQAAHPYDAARSGAASRLGARELRLQARPFALPHPKEQIVLIQGAYYQCWIAPRDDSRLDALFLDVFAKRSDLIVVEADEQPAVTGPSLRRRFGLIQDQLEPQQAHLKYVRPALFLMVPVQREAERFGV